MSTEKKQSTEMTKPAQTSSSIQKYADYDETDTENARSDFESQTGPTIWFKIEDGEKLKVRVLPPPVGENGKKRPRWRALRVHRVPMPGAKFPFRVVCPQQWTDSYGDAAPRGSCPICAEVLRIKQKADKLEDEGKVGKAEAERDRAWELSAQRRCFANILVRGKEAEGPKLWEFSGGGKKSIEKRLLAILESPDEDDGGPSMASIGPKGYDLKIEREGEGKFDTTYTISVGKRCALAEDAKQAQEILDAQHNVDRLKQFKVLATEDILKVLAGEEPGEEGDEEKPRKRGGDAPRAKPVEEPSETIEGDLDVELD